MAAPGIRVVPCHHLNSIPVAATISITAAAAAAAVAAPPLGIERAAEVDANHKPFLQLRKEVTTCSTQSQPVQASHSILHWVIIRN